MLRIINTISKVLVASFTNENDAVKYVSDNNLASTCGIFPDNEQDIKEDESMLNNECKVIGRINMDRILKKEKEAAEFRRQVAHYFATFGLDGNTGE